jgi:hypothetical protein
MKIRIMRREVEVSAAEIFRLWGSDLPNDEVAEKLGLTRGQMWVISRRLKLPARPKHLTAWADNSGRKKDDPTPEQIAERAAIVRMGWDEFTYASRAVGRSRSRYQIPAFRCTATTSRRNVAFVNSTHEF